MVLSVFDLDDYRDYFDIHPIRKIANETTGYDCLLMGTRFGIGFIGPNGAVVERPQFELDVKGRIRCTEIYTVSDEAEKLDITGLTPERCEALVRDVNVYRYRLRPTADRPDGTRKVGFLAQDLEKLDAGEDGASLVDDAAGGKKSVDTVQLLAIAIGALQKLQQRVDALEAEAEAARVRALYAQKV